MSRRLEGKNALVTGSTQGLGAVIARAFAREGARVAVTGLPPEKGREVAASLGNGSVFVPGNLADVEETRGVAREALRALGEIDILVNNAANVERSTLEDFTPELFDRQFHINVRAPLLLAQELLGSLRRRRGVVINIGSINAHVGWPNLLVYSATKAALLTVSRNLANALKYARVRVHCLNPGWMDTDGERVMMARLGHPPDFLEREGKRLPLGRLLKPEEVAELVVHLAGDGGVAFSGIVADLEQYPIGVLCHPEDTEPMQ
jgi:NAD(P)-dependent dehydrogenase (short-subunit alcohol dehydrogenase family)